MATIGHIVLPIIAGILFRLSAASFTLMLFFSLLPDLDIVASLVFTGGMFDWHRGVTHSLLFACIPLLVYAFIRKKELLWGFAGALSHPLIDVLDLHGAPLLWPFSNQIFSLGLWSSTSIEDVLMLRFFDPSSFLSDKAILLLLIVSLAYLLASRWYHGSVKRGRGKPAKKGRN